MQVITNNHWRPFKYGYEVPEKIREREYDWLDEDAKTDGWIYYRRNWYHISDFTDASNPYGGAPDGELAKAGWTGMLSDSYFSGVVIRLSEDGEQYQIALILS